MLSPEGRQNNAGLFTEDTLRSTAIFIHEAKNTGLNLSIAYPFAPQAQPKIDEYLRSLER
jgi:hypothetical protein